MSLILSGTDGLSDVDGSAATPAIRGTDANTGIFFPAADTIAFAEGGAEVARFDSSGNFGLGVTPSAFTIGKTIQIGALGNVSILGYDTSGFYQTNSYYNAGWKYAANGYAVQYLQINGTHQWLVGANNTSGAGATVTAFGQGSAMTLDNSGNLLVGQTTQSNSEKFGVVGSNAGPMIYGRNTSVSGFASQFSCDNASWTGGSVSYFGISGYSPNNTARSFFYANDSTALRFQVYSNGGIANYSANNVNLSDRREKTNFAPAKSYLDVICAIPIQTFNYIDQSEDDPGLTLGVVAQDVQAVAPELVMESNWGTEEFPKQRLSIYQTDLQYALMKCIQEQQALITQLTARITALENK